MKHYTTNEAIEATENFRTFYEVFNILETFAHYTGYDAFKLHFLCYTLFASLYTHIARFYI